MENSKSFNDPQALVQGRNNMDLLSFETAQVFLFIMLYSKVGEITVSFPEISGRFEIVFLHLLQIVCSEY